MLKLAGDDVGDGLEFPVGVPVERIARKPIFHQEEERVSRTPIVGRHKLPHAVLQRHSLLHFRMVDPEHRSFEGCHGEAYIGYDLITRIDR